MPTLGQIVKDHFILQKRKNNCMVKKVKVDWKKVDKEIDSLNGMEINQRLFELRRNLKCRKKERNDYDVLISELEQNIFDILGDIEILIDKLEE